jgi:hypothetical protein
MSERSMRRARGRAFVAGAAALGAGAVFAPPASAGSLVVDTGGDGGDSSCDPGACTLRDAIDDANDFSGATTITFGSSVTGQITLETGFLPITYPVAIEGPGASVLTVSGDDNSKIFYAIEAGSVSISGLTLTDGFSSTHGGAIRSYGTDLTISDAVLAGNDAAQQGGAIWFTGADESLLVERSTIAGNSAVFGGGITMNALDVEGDGSTITQSTISGNEAEFAGGGLALYDVRQDVRVSDSTVSGNSVTGIGFDYGDAGGGVGIGQLYDHAFILANSTVAGNAAPEYGGGIARATRVR